MGGVLFFMLVAYLGAGVFIMRRHYLQKHGVALTRHTPLFGAGTSLVFFWPLAMAFGGDAFRNPKPCTHYRHVQERARLRRELEEYQQLLREEQGE